MPLASLCQASDRRPQAARALLPESWVYTAETMSEATPIPPMPDHLSIDSRSPFHVAVVFEHGIGIWFNDKERVDVAEYCISENWIKVNRTP